MKSPNIERDHPSMDEWATVIGRIVLNFGIIESLINSSLSYLQGTPESDYLNKPLQNRIDQLTKKIKNQKNQKYASAMEALRRTKKLANTRNVLVHNPLLFFHKGDLGQNSPLFAIIPNLKPTKNGKKTSPALIKMDDLLDSGDESAALVDELELLEKHLANQASHTTP